MKLQFRWHIAASKWMVMSDGNSLFQATGNKCMLCVKWGRSSKQLWDLPAVAGPTHSGTFCPHWQPLVVLLHLLQGQWHRHENPMWKDSSRLLMDIFQGTLPNFPLKILSRKVEFMGDRMWSKEKGIRGMFLSRNRRENWMPVLCGLSEGRPSFCLGLMMCEVSPGNSMGKPPRRAEALPWGRTLFCKPQCVFHFSGLFRTVN